MKNSQEKLIERKKVKRNKLMEEYNSLNRHDFSGSWVDRIRNNTGPQFCPAGMTDAEHTKLYNKNVEKKLNIMRKYNEKTKKKLLEMQLEIEQLEDAARASDVKIDVLVKGIVSATPDKRERAFFGAIGDLLGGKRGRRG